MTKIFDELFNLALTVAFFGGISYGVYLGPKGILHKVRTLTLEQAQKQNFSLYEFSKKMTRSNN